MRRIINPGSAMAVAALSVLVLTGAATDNQPGAGKSGQHPRGLDVASLVKSEKLIDHGRSKLVEFKDSHGERKFYAKVSPRTKVYLTKTDDGSYEIGVRPYDPGTDEAVEQMAKELSAGVIEERKKPLPEQAAAGRAAPGWALAKPSTAIVTGNTAAIYDSGCLYITSEMYVKGCYERRRVPEAILGWYLRMDTSEISGHHSGVYGSLTGMKSRHDYDDGYTGTEVVKNRPAATIDTGSCHNETIGIAYEGFGVSEEVRVCPERISPYVRAKYFHHAWSGRVKEDSSWRWSLGHSVVKARDGHSNGFDYRISAFQDDPLQNDSWINKG